MKIFLCVAFKSSSKDQERISNLLNCFDQTKHSLDKYFFDVNEDSDDYSDVLKRIREADVFIGEMSRASQTQGFLLSYALSHQKPSLYLYDETTYGRPKSPIINNPSRLLTVSAYEGIGMSKMTNNFLNKAETQLYFQRITFICSKEIYEYIDTKSKKLDLAKGEVIRSLLEKAIDLDKNAS